MTDPGRERAAWPAALAAVAIGLAVLAVYAPVRDFPFVVYDDKAWVSENPHVRVGLRTEGVIWAFTQQEQGNYVPLAWLSHMLDVELFGLDAGRHHALNALLHLLSSLLLFELLRRATGALAPSCFTALVFAIHPAHVESVAWVSERRDTLSGLFWMLTLAAYLHWLRARSRRPARYALLLGVYALGLLAKPILVTLPLVLLLLDLWPLQRGDVGWARLLREKLPLFGLAALAAALALATQGAAQAVVSLDQVPFSARLANATTGYVAYLGKALWPLELAVFYPYDLEIPLWKSLGSALLLAAITGLALWQRRRRPWLAVGWLWYGVTLLPVIGLVQVGSQGMADRYTYLPFIGLALAAAWQGAELAARRPARRPVLVGLAAVWLAFCGVLARAQVWTWRDSVALFLHARSVTGDNHVVHANLGEAYEDAGRGDDAIREYAEALELFPAARQLDLRVGRLLAARGQLERASLHLQRAVRLHPTTPGARLELAIVALRAGQREQAAELLAAERTLAPEDARVPFHLGELAALAGDADGAREEFGAAFALDPELADAPVRDRDAQVAAALAAALADAERAGRAAFWARRGLVLARAAGDLALATRLAEALEGYERSAAATP